MLVFYKNLFRHQQELCILCEFVPCWPDGATLETIHRAIGVRCDRSFDVRGLWTFKTTTQKHDIRKTNNVYVYVTRPIRDLNTKYHGQ